MEKEPIFSKSVSTGTRVYYIDVFADRQDRPFIVISEIPKDDKPGSKKRQKIFLHTDQYEKFATALHEVANFIHTLKNQ